MEEIQRIGRDALNIQIAMLISERATCLRRKVGAVVAMEGRIISTGYNGPAYGLQHCGPDTCNLEHSCTRAAHAEANAIAAAAKFGVSLQGATLYCTLSPCTTCANLIINAGIKKVYYLNEYRVNDGILLLKKLIQVEQLPGLH